MSSTERSFFQIPTPRLLGAIGASTPLIFNILRNPSETRLFKLEYIVVIWISYLEHFQNSLVDISFGPILLLNPLNSFRVFGQSTETRWISVAEESESAANMARSGAVCSAEFSNFAEKELGSHHRGENAKRRDIFVRVVDSRHRSGHEVNRESKIPRWFTLSPGSVY